VKIFFSENCLYITKNVCLNQLKSRNKTGWQPAVISQVDHQKQFQQQKTNFYNNFKN
jgi:hypothetical protein